MRTTPAPPTPSPVEAGEPRPRFATLLPYLLAGVYFGIALTRSEAISWYRVQEMFRFQSPRMYLIIAGAIATAALGMSVIRGLGIRALNGEPITVPPKVMGRGYRYWIGGTVFGIGWALTGACPGPLIVLLGAGIGPIALAIVSALAGTWTYGLLRPRLPH